MKRIFETGEPMNRYHRNASMVVYLFASVAALLTLADSTRAQGIPVRPLDGIRPLPSPADPSQLPVDILAKDWDAKSQIDWDVAATLALLSKTAYEKDDELMGFVANGMGFNSCESFNKANSAAHVLVGDDVVVIAFRGTEFTSMADWKTDAYIRFFKDPFLGNVHTGFNKAYQDVRSDVENVLRQSDGKTIWVTGHSLGGAMAVICATRIKQERLGQPRIMTFGQPRVGDKAAAQWIDRAFPKSYQRFVNDNDVVARLPYSNWVFPYSDAGRFIHLDRGNLRLMTGARTEMLATSSAPQENKLLTYAPQQTPNNTGIVRQPVLGSSGVETREVYQAPNALLPLEESELDQLIEEERSRSRQPSARLYFPNAEDTTAPVVPVYGSEVDNPAVGMVRTAWWPFDRISDHFMAGYLKLIRGLRK